ncbi:uncharacterized protein LOC112457767 [Temnothorax curvispinosus]|uniref:Uncharacterized protein LOC112453669 n=1 Tax=Temnothorax curvispinosus TaxID=300111 RepID=A0A6J1Q5Q9_9HYME|nr:uncharacterized protein LOC112453669 [Temnothorax curvispinosus]XP_024876761.1 uncharacterized protein LOC112457767 [Temnothorax curvispinosus]
MESEARDQINNYYDEFYATICHVCKRFGDGVQLKRCGGCWMIAYCGKEHQKQHWKQHKPLCKAIRNVLRNYNMDYGGETTEVWASKKLTFAQLVSSKLGRRLNMSEMNMFLFPKECLVCYERNIKSLESCQKCAASFCKNHKDGTEHRDICASLELCLHSDLFSMREGNSLLDLNFHFQHISYIEFPSSTFQNMKDFLKACMNIQTDSEMCNARANYSSEYLTYSLTLFFAMRLLKYVPKSEDLVVHVLGATKHDELILIGWEIFPRLIGAKVSVILIGPELPCKSMLSHHCDNCMSREKKCLTFELHDGLYENYVRSSSFVKPDLVVGFNMGVRNHELPVESVESSKETWTPSIELIAKENCPFILTSSLLYAFKKETDIINTILDKEVNHIYSGKNPFASLIPCRTVGGLEYVSYTNQYVIIYRSLCS